MPVYTYKCSNCAHEFEEQSNIESREKPLQFPCLQCNQLGSLYIRVHAPKLSYSGQRVNIDDNFNARLRQIQGNLPPSAHQNITDQMKK